MPVPVVDYRGGATEYYFLLTFADALDMGDPDAAVHWDRDVQEVVDVREVLITSYEEECVPDKVKCLYGPLEVMGPGLEFYRYVWGKRWFKVRDERGQATPEWKEYCDSVR